MWIKNFYTGNGEQEQMPIQNLIDVIDKYKTTQWRKRIRHLKPYDE